MKPIRAIAALSVLLFSAACTQTFTSNVVRFHSMESPAGESIRVIPNEEGRDGPEFRLYADQVVAELQSLGYSPAGEADPDLMVQVSYSVEERASGYRFSRWRQPFFFGIHYGTYPWGPYGWRHYPFYPSFFYGAHDQDIYNFPRYAKMLEVVISKPDGEIIFEGRAVNRNNTRSLTDAMPYLVKSLFQGFPGESGKTSRVVFDLSPPEEGAPLE